MSLEIQNTENVRADGGGMIADRRLYLTKVTATSVEAEPAQRIVEEGDPEAAFLLAGPGGVIPDDQVKALGLETEDGKVVQSKAKKAELASQPAEDDPSLGEPKAPAAKKRAAKKKGGK
jgi:hypothetical protein